MNGSTEKVPNKGRPPSALAIRRKLTTHVLDQANMVTRCGTHKQTRLALLAVLELVETKTPGTLCERFAEEMTP